jgi:hypothetical protein
MKALKASFMIMFVAVSLFTCNAQTSETPKTENILSEDIQVYYFHNTARCATCNAVENETKIALEMYYADKMKAGAMDFTSLNLQEDEGKEMAQTLHVSGQTLLIVKGETQVNLTNEGFMNARTNPTKFHEIIKAQIDKLL